MSIQNQLHHQHLLWRAGFGPLPEEIPQHQQVNLKTSLKALFKASEVKPTTLAVAADFIQGLGMGVTEAGRLQQPALSDAQRKQIRVQSREALKNLNLLWLGEMINSKQQLREKMALFWHGHFASRNLNILYQQQLLDIIRRNALGNFGTLLTEVSKSAAMINFLNNNQNRKGHPNENFARELMELFTIGRGNYTETDVKEAARAFTGWGAALNGSFVFRTTLHDKGSKTILGKTGNFQGEEVLQLLLAKPETARFITRKLYRFLVNEVVNEDRLQWLATRFYQSNYSISSLLEDILSSNWFYAAENLGNRIKSPVELLVGIQRALPLTWQRPEVQLQLQRLLGQVLFYPPNVAGWPGGKNWIDSSTLMLRMRLPQLLFTSTDLELRPKSDDDQQMGMTEQQKTGLQRLGASINWEAYLKQYASTERNRLGETIHSRLLLCNNTRTAALLLKHTDSSSREQYIKTTTIQCMSSPEYQLC